MKKPTRKRKPNTRHESLRDQLATIIQRNHVARTSSDETARQIVRHLIGLPPRCLFLGICADPSHDR